MNTEYSDGFHVSQNIHALWEKNGLSWTIIILRIVSLVDYVKKLKYSILYYQLEVIFQLF